MSILVATFRSCLGSHIVGISLLSLPGIARRHNRTEDFLVLWLPFCPHLCDVPLSLCYPSAPCSISATYTHSQAITDLFHNSLWNNISFVLLLSVTENIFRVSFIALYFTYYIILYIALYYISIVSFVST